uniref:Uncharacterized protein n=1 Tax=Anaerobacillus isosaccharinicus TaxID=1532552 RepID=A0A1S2LS83_9BACI
MSGCSGEESAFFKVKESINFSHFKNCLAPSASGSRSNNLPAKKVKKHTFLLSEHLLVAARRALFAFRIMKALTLEKNKGDTHEF